MSSAFSALRSYLLPQDGVDLDLVPELASLPPAQRRPTLLRAEILASRSSYAFPLVILFTFTRLWPLNLDAVAVRVVCEEAVNPLDLVARVPLHPEAGRFHRACRRMHVRDEQAEMLAALAGGLGPRDKVDVHAADPIPGAAKVERPGSRHLGKAEQTAVKLPGALHVGDIDGHVIHTGDLHGEHGHPWYSRGLIE